MHQLIQVINRLQDVWNCIGASPIELPQLVVVGSQSAGKSSVLENIVGRDFLPRGRDIVTRRPLILQLVNTRPPSESELYGPDTEDGGLIDRRPPPHHSQQSSRDHDETDSQNGDQTPQLQSRSSRPGTGPNAASNSTAAAGTKDDRDSKSDSKSKGGDDSNGKSRAGAAAGANSGDEKGGGAASSQTEDMSEWGEFKHKPGVKFSDFEEIRNEINRETDRLLGNKKQVSKAPILLKIYSPYVLNLTLIDLPGMTKVPVGDQPTDIEKQIRDMIWDYISSPASIIVAVSPGNADLANSDALKIAREADPQGHRTIGVITKIDLMDKGTDAMDILTGKVFQLSHGFVGLVNRSQLDINQNKNIRLALADERKFFNHHAVYRSISTRCGTAYLAKRLNTILMSHIQSSLPDMRSKIAHSIAETQEELESYGNPLLNSPVNLGPLLLHLLSKFCNNYCDALEGKSPDVSITQLYGGARISYIFHDVFCKRLDNINPFDELTDQDIRTAIRNATGPRPSLFIPEISFELLVKRQIERLQQPSLQCVDLVFDELKRVASQCESLVAELQRFPVLRENVYDTVRALLERRLKPTKTMINNLVHVELAYINTNHPDFIGGSKAVSSLMDRMAAMQAQATGGGAGSGASSGKSGSGKGGSGDGSGRSGDRDRDRDDIKSPGSSGSAKNKSVSPVPIDAANPMTLFGRTDNRASSSGRKSSQSNSNNSGNDSDNKSLVALTPVRDRDDESPHGGAAASTAAGARPEKPKRDRLHLEDPKPMPVPGLHKPIQSIPVPLPTDRELIETEIIKSLISSYFNIVRKNIQDSVPKAIMYFLVNHSKQDIQSELVRTLYKEVRFEGLLKEADDVSQKRAQCVEHLRTMRKAHDIVNSVKDYNPLAM